MLVEAVDNNWGDVSEKGSKRRPRNYRS
jgi:hypothetical protein